MTPMKKFYLLLLVSILIISCSKDDGAVNSTTSINPPAWIHGTWRSEGAGGTSITGLQFTANDMILLGLTNMSHKNNISSIIKSGGEVTVDENISQEDYDITIEYSMGTSINYSFSKVDDNTIIWNSTAHGDLELQKQ